MTCEQAVLLLEQVGFTVQQQANGYFIQPQSSMDAGIHLNGSLAQGEVLTETGLIILAENLFKIYEHLLRTKNQE